MRFASRVVVVWMATLLSPFESLAEDPVQVVRDCMKRNIPKRSSSQTLHFVYKDRTGGERECKGKAREIRAKDDLRRARLCITEPDDMRDTELLSIEASGRAPDTHLYLPATRSVKRITGEGMGGSVCGSDVSYEDLQRLSQLDRPENHERLPDGEVEGHPVFVLVSRPVDSKESAYTKVTSYVDKKTCVVIKSESFQAGERPRKVMTAKPDELLESNGIHAPAHVVVRDLRDETSTTVTASDLEVDGEIDEKSFELSRLGKRKGCR
jgi:hypothetical protein